MSLCTGLGRSVGTIVERYAILGIGGHNLVETEPELVVPSVRLLSSSLDDDTTRTIHTNTIGNDRRLGSALGNLREEAAHVVAFHVAVVNQVDPANLLSLANSLELHALDSNISPVGTLDSVQVAETLVLRDLLQVNDVSVAFLIEVLGSPSHTA